jgi:lysozyme family protein
MSTQKQRDQMGQAILDFEARRDRKGHIAIYPLPPGDGGGTVEVAGINNRYHPTECSALITMIRGKQYDKAEKYARDYFIRYTDVVTNWGGSDLDPGVEFFLRDSVFNRGPTGAARILQMALETKVDGIVGEVTKGALKTADPKDLLLKLRVAREKYERLFAHRSERSIFWRGLVNRWNNALKTAKNLDQVEVA